MVRLFHTSDWHLGRSLHGRSLLEDQNFVIDRLIELIDERKPHAILLAGDVFDRPLPPELAVALFDRFLDEVAGRRNLPVALIPGNHDSNERLGFASSLLRGRNVTIFSKLDDAFFPLHVRGDDGASVLIYGIPFVEPVEIARHLNRDDLLSPNDATTALCKAMLAEKEGAAPAVLLCHAFVAGGEESESEKTIFIGGSSQVDPRAFEGFSYTALGHLHKPQSAGGANVRYSGSLLPYSKSEVGHVKSVTEICLGTDASASVETLPLRALRSLRYVEGPLASLLAGDVSADYIIAGYTDSGAVLDAFAKLRGVYENLLHVSRAGGYVPEFSPALSRAREREAESDLDLFAEFFRASTGEAANAEELAVLTSVLEEIEREERMT